MFEKGIVADVLVKTRSLGRALIRYDWCPHKTGKSGQRDMNRNDMKMKAEIRAMLLQAKDHERLPAKPSETRLEVRNRFALTALKRNLSCQYQI